MTSWKNNNTLESRRLAEEILNPPKKARKSRKVVVESLPQLRELIDDRVREFGPNCDLNDLDVSRITNMNRLFYGSEFNGNISKWDVSSVKDMAEMFAYSKFKGNISRWDTSNVEDMNSMFADSEFRGDISKWNVSKVKDMRWMFALSPLEGKEPSWYRRRAQLNIQRLNPGNL